MSVELIVGSPPADIVEAAAQHGGTPFLQAEQQRWVRYLPRVSPYGVHEFPIQEHSGLSPFDTVQTLFEHYRKFEKLGVQIAPSVFYLTNADQPEARIYTVSQHIEGTPAKHLLSSPEGCQKLRELAGPLVKYCSYLDTQSHYLWDFSPLDQYVLRHQPDQPIADGQFTYTDTDAIVGQVYTDGPEGTTGDIQYRFLREGWIDQIM